MPNEDEEAVLDSVFSPSFSGAARAEMYRAWVIPDMYPDERQPRLENWTAEDREAFCGIYTKESV